MELSNYNAYTKFVDVSVVFVAIINFGFITKHTPSHNHFVRDSCRKYLRNALLYTFTYYNFITNI